MNGVVVTDNNDIMFMPELISELVVLNKGSKARATIHRVAEKEAREKTQRAFTQAAAIPILIPANRKEIRKRGYGLAQNIGSAVGEALQQRGVPEHWQGATVEEFVMRIVADVLCGYVKKDEFGDYGSTEQICLNAGGSVQMVLRAVFTEKELKNKPVFAKMLDAVLHGFRGAFEAEKSA